MNNLQDYTLYQLRNKKALVEQEIDLECKKVFNCNLEFAKAKVFELGEIISEIDDRIRAPKIGLFETLSTAARPTV